MLTFLGRSRAECKVKGVAGSQFVDFLGAVAERNARLRLLLGAGLLTFLGPSRAEARFTIMFATFEAQNHEKRKAF